MMLNYNFKMDYLHSANMIISKLSILPEISHNAFPQNGTNKTDYYWFHVLRCSYVK